MARRSRLGVRIGLVASMLAVVVFVTGKDDLHAVLGGLGRAVQAFGSDADAAGADGAGKESDWQTVERMLTVRNDGAAAVCELNVLPAGAVPWGKNRLHLGGAPPDSLEVGEHVRFPVLPGRYTLRAVGCTGRELARAHGFVVRGDTLWLVPVPLSFREVRGEPRRPWRVQGARTS